VVIPTRIWEYLVAAILIIIAPGPSVLFIVARAIAWGRKTAVITAAGNVTGALLLSVIVAIGLGPVLQRSDLAYSAVQWGGGAYLIYLGVDAIAHRRIHAAKITESNDGHPSGMKSFRDGFWVGVLNPKALVFFAAILPQFIDRSRGFVTEQLLLLGVLFALLALVSDGSWGFIAGTARDWLASNPVRLIKLRTGGGMVMIALGAIVVASAIRHALH
jgi:threonine/homoserine/homoserine lactone efflux protein